MPDCCGDHKFMTASHCPVSFNASRSMVAAMSIPKYLGGTLRVATMIAVAAVSLPAFAQSSVPVVRDAEIEELVTDYARPILKVAGLQKSNIEIILVNDSSFNAFVDGRRLFINTGALLTAESPNEIIGVIAHEAGHLAGGHQERLRDQLRRAQTMAVVAGLVGLGATVAGAATNNAGIAQAGTGIAAGGGEFARRTLLGYQRTEETTADRSAITYLEKTGQSAKGMLKTFSRFEDALSLTGTRVDPYQISHPMPRDRIAALETLAKASPNFDKTDSPALQLRHDLARAKISAFTQDAGFAARMLRRQAGGLPSAYADAIRTYLSGSTASALKKVDALIAQQPKSPWFHELRGDVLMKANQPSKAAASYAKALELDPARSPILQFGHAKALVAANDAASLKAAVGELTKGLQRDRENVEGYQLLAQAQIGLGNIAEGELASAEANFYSGNYAQAKSFAARAQQKLKTGSPAWLRAQDILQFKSKPKKS